ncbi:phosphoglucomutase/phosphomannomutase family protein [Candidatus Synechococcus calcipolaris G9]|uniref:Phosphoglucomutase/phosphomannomutase family protein n=1 Tax=Candidatus Synechococcus calcipolaris G9 TaxID=1497997 RepID=A0ABT6EYM3_9SYNE|nr:phosphoglucomutase/phosphomannomutase family protein [Candidatus Synechococcus calcipolaris]MDG2990619.1 phosphoglucomutase/phosphomannomutase family protein [Candidatus Synechococcus calcipolaris G9]
MFWQGIHENSPIRFGTDGWRGVIGAEFTFPRLIRGAQAAAQVLEATYGIPGQPRRIMVGFDLRFLAEEFAQAVAHTLEAQGFDVFLAQGPAPTPALSWAATEYQALGSLVITASHNPGIYSGLKVKGAFGGSVGAAVTQDIEALANGPLEQLERGTSRQTSGFCETFDPWRGYCKALKQKVDLGAIQGAIASGQLQVYADVMHGAAQSGLGRLLDCPIQELNANRDPLFAGGAPEPIGRYLAKSQDILRTAGQGFAGQTICLVFDGDGDRISAIDGQGQLFTAQELIPILIDHLVQEHNQRGMVIKSLSASSLIGKIAALHHLPVIETPIGFKHIGDRMMVGDPVLLGGEESGGIGYGNHIPERDALLSGLYLLEALVKSGHSLSEYYQMIQEKTKFTAHYGRVDLPLASLEVKGRLERSLATEPPDAILGTTVQDCQTFDGYKFYLGDRGWLLIRFSGTEPLLRIYCEAPTAELVDQTLTWGKNWAEAI